MRVFIAIDIDEGIRKSLADLQREMLGKVDIKKSDAKWVNPDIMHLTMKFLGEIKDVQSVDVCNVARVVAGRNKAFDIEVGCVGFFGGRSARVLWVGTGQDDKNLLQLHDDLEEQLASAGWPKDNKKFAGHLTLCRIRNSRAGMKLARVTEEYRNFKIGFTTVDSITVYQSELTPKGPVYTSLGKYDLK